MWNSISVFLHPIHFIIYPTPTTWVWLPACSGLATWLTNSICDATLHSDVGSVYLMEKQPTFTGCLILGCCVHQVDFLMICIEEYSMSSDTVLGDKFLFSWLTVFCWVITMSTVEKKVVTRHLNPIRISHIVTLIGRLRLTFCGKTSLCILYLAINLLFNTN